MSSPTYPSRRWRVGLPLSLLAFASLAARCGGAPPEAEEAPAGSDTPSTDEAPAAVHEPTTGGPPGSDRDEHGCIPSAGYMWCAADSACVRPWELARERGLESPAAAMAYCEGSAHGPIVGGDRDEHGCIASAGYIWCAAASSCVRSWELAQERGLASPEAAVSYCEGGPAEP